MTADWHGAALLLVGRGMKPAAPQSPWVGLLLALDGADGWVAVLAALAVFAAGVGLALWLRRRLDRHSRQRRAARAQRAERDAVPLLEARGFEVLGRQVRQSWGLLADGDEVRFTLVADYLVQRGGRRWVAEVKTGPRALDLRHGPTRRQLLEYREAFAVDGVLLVDPEGQALQSVAFRERGRASGARGRWLLAFGVGLLLGLALAGYWASAYGASADRDRSGSKRASGSGGGAGQPSVGEAARGLARSKIVGFSGSPSR